MQRWKEEVEEVGNSPIFTPSLPQKAARGVGGVEEVTREALPIRTPLLLPPPLLAGEGETLSHSRLALTERVGEGQHRSSE
mmetsp:Transcript_48792/g.126448  ORF Transcript_48792/g.126448 Transcript_48792/m.126448 type:complete len:81 (-) Transcript_48792:123-365(-)